MKTESYISEISVRSKRGRIPRAALIGSSVDVFSNVATRAVSFNILSGGRRWNPRIAIPSHAHAQRRGAAPMRDRALDRGIANTRRAG